MTARPLVSSYSRPADRGTIVVWGLLGSYPFGGMTWQVLHHLVPLRRLGFDVWYVEDPDVPVFDPVTYDPTYEVDANVDFLARQLERVGLGDRWIFRAAGTGRTYGGEPEDLRRLYAKAEVAVNVTGAHAWRPEHDEIGCRIYVETDPVPSQIAVARGDPAWVAELGHYHHVFSYGANLGAPDCRLPVERFRWRTTRPPVVPEWWQADGAPRQPPVLTTVTNWRQNGAEVEWEGERWTWRKDVAFEPFLDLPARAALPLELAVGALGDGDWEMLGRRGWRTIPSATLAAPDAYRRYIRESAGEFTAAKEQYVRSRSGWFSDRSVCYLAAGRPVITQDTGFGNGLPTGEGLLSFTDPDEALDAIAAVAADYGRHALAAREIAREHFDAERLMGEMLRSAGVL